MNFGITARQMLPGIISQQAAAPETLSPAGPKLKDFPRPGNSANMRAHCRDASRHAPDLQ
jgi:hypothetical protein